MRYLQLLLEDGKTDQALSVTRKIASLKPTQALARETENTLLAAQQVDAARQFRAQISGGNRE